MVDRYRITKGELALHDEGELVLFEQHEAEAAAAADRAEKVREAHAQAVQALNGQLLEAGRANAALAEQRDEYLLAAADRKLVLEQIRESIDAVLPQPPPTPLEDIVAEFIAKLPKPATTRR